LARRGLSPDGGALFEVVRNDFMDERMARKVKASASRTTIPELSGQTEFPPLLETVRENVSRRLG
jgi:hypothetical protein